MQKSQSAGVWILAISLAFMLASCETGNSGTEADMSIKSDSTGASDTTIKKIIHSIPSPMLMADLIRESGSEFDNSVLNKTENAKNYALETKKAINLGVYGADLSYASIFDQRQVSMNYMAAAQKLARDLGVDGVLQDDLLERLNNNQSNRDSLLNIVSEAYADLNDYLKDNNRQSISALVVAGGWMEGLYLATHHASKNGNAALKQRVAEQKYSLDRLIELCDQYKNDPAMKETISDLNAIKELFSNVQMAAAPATHNTDSDGTMVIGGGNTFTISDADLQAISKRISEIRSRYIS